MNRFIAVASGKGGVGKTTLAVNLAWGLSSHNQRVCLIDADLGLANVDIVLGLAPRYTLEHILFENVPLKQALVPVRENLDVVSGGSGVPRLAALTRSQRSRLFWEFQKLTGYDTVLVDCSPGLSPQVIALCLAARELVVVVTPDATAITDGYALIKVLRENGLQFPPLVAVNSCRSQAQAKSIFDKLNHTSRRFLGQTLLFLGGVTRHEFYGLEIERRRPLISIKPQAPSSRDMAAMVQRLKNRPRQKLFQLRPEDFWEKAIVQIQSRAGLEDPAHKALTRSAGDLEPEEALDVLDHFLETLGQSPDSRTHLPNSFLLKLGRLTEKIDLLARKTNPADTPTSLPTSRRAVGIVAPDSEMRALLSDIVQDTGSSALDLLAEPGAAARVDLALYCLERQDMRLSAFQGRLQNVPGILLTSYPSSNHSFLSSNNIRKVITKPFNVREIYQALEELTLKQTPPPL